MTRFWATLMTTRSKQQGQHVALIHSGSSAESLATQLGATLLGPDVDEARLGSMHVAVVHTGSSNWLATLSSARRGNPSLRVIALAADVAAAAKAVNRAKVDRLVHREQDLPQAIAELLSEPLSERVQLEREVESRTALLQQIKSQWEQSFDAVQDPMAVVDATYRLVRVNRAYARHLGRPIVDVPGRSCYRLRAQSPHAYAAKDDGPCASCPVQPTQQTGQPAQSTIEDSAGLRWMVSAYPVDIPNLPGSVVVHYRDVTEEVERLAKMAKADKTSAVGKLAGAVAHELNGPMTAIMVFSEALARKTESGTELNEHATEVQQSAYRCRRLVQGLLRFARRPRGREPASVSVAAVLDEVRPLLQHRLDVAQISLVLDLDDQLDQIRAHVADIEHLLVDLITNALEACSRGDTIRISATNLKGQELIELKIIDSGRGMEPETLAAAFDPFFTTKPEGLAAGLGLTTCEAMVADMGGLMGLESAPDEGTVAWIRLPTMRKRV